MKRVIFRLSALCGALAIVAVLGAASAVVLTPGEGPVAPDLFTPPSGTLLATLLSTFTTGTGQDTGTLVTEVIRTFGRHLGFPVPGDGRQQQSGPPQRGLGEYLRWVL